MLELTLSKQIQLLEQGTNARMNRLVPLQISRGKVGQCISRNRAGY